ncbi:hypothetical protein AB7M18_003570 [Pseudomonas viridiflava]
MSNEFKLVPVEPTDAMVRAGMGVGDDNCLYWKHPQQAYVDMLAAAPQPPALGGDVVVIGNLHRDCDERIVFESSGEIHIKDGMPVYGADSVAPLQAEIERLKEESFEGLYNAAIDERDQLKVRCDELEAAVQHLVCSGYLKLLPEEVQQRFTACMRYAQSDSLRVALSTLAGNECCATCSSRNGSNYCDCGDE